MTTTSSTIAILLPLLIAWGAVPLTALAGAVSRRAAGPVAILAAVLTFGSLFWSRQQVGGTVTIPWAPTWQLTLSFTNDPLAIFYALLASGIGIAVLVYAVAYIPLHLHHQQRSLSAEPRFYILILLFMASMIGLVLAQDLLLIFLFWDLTAIASYFLIGYDQEQRAAQTAALMALLVTGISAVWILIGSLLLQQLYGTFELPAMIAAARPGQMHSIALGLIVAGALVKSAQVPFHFWLPRAMAAPTPVSAYLHSAAMVAAGVFLIGRFYPLVRLSPTLLNGLLLIGFGSIFTGSVLALGSDRLKPLLAYSTIAQYGYVVVMLGFGTAAGVVGATFYVLAHALAKSALFLTAGAATEATATDRLADLGGLARSQPVLAVASGVAAAGLGALPLTIGFFKDELFFAAALEQGPALTALTVLAAALTFSYTWHFWSRIFLGPMRGQHHPLPWQLVAPVALLALFVLVGGLSVAPFAQVAIAAAGSSFAGLTAKIPAYHFDTRAENLLALAAYGLGATIVGTRRWWGRVPAFVAYRVRWFTPERLYHRTLTGLNRLSRVMLAIELRDLRGRITTVLVPTALLALAGFAATPTVGAFHYGAVTWRDLPLVLSLFVVIVAALATAVPRSHLTIVLALSSVGYSLCATFAFFGAPNVAMIMALAETILTLLVLGVLGLFPRAVLIREQTRPEPRALRLRNVTVGAIAGIFAFATTWAVLSQPSSRGTMANDLIQMTSEAHAKNTVTAILADFRGLDTLGEITVIWIVFVGLFTLLRRGRVRQ